jgi:hypothetical protein
VVREMTSQIRRGQYETARENEPDEGNPEEEKYQKKPEKIEGGTEVFHLINESGP